MGEFYGSFEPPDGREETDEISRRRVQRVVPHHESGSARAMSAKGALAFPRTITFELYV